MSHRNPKVTSLETCDLNKYIESKGEEKKLGNYKSRFRMSKGQQLPVLRRHQCNHLAFLIVLVLRSSCRRLLSICDNVALFNRSTYHDLYSRNIGTISLAFSFVFLRSNNIQNNIMIISVENFVSILTFAFHFFPFSLSVSWKSRDHR